MVKNMHVNTGDAGNMGSIPGLGKSPGGGTGNPLQYSCLENPMDRGAWQATVQSQKELDPTQAQRETLSFRCFFVLFWFSRIG